MYLCVCVCVCINVFVRGFEHKHSKSRILVFEIIISFSLNFFPSVRGLRVFSLDIHTQIKIYTYAQTFENDAQCRWRETNWTAKGWIVPREQPTPTAILWILGLRFTSVHSTPRCGVVHHWRRH